MMRTLHDLPVPFRPGDKDSPPPRCPSHELPLYGRPEHKAVDTFPPAHPAMPRSKHMDTEPSSFEESLASMLCDLQNAVCRQHEMFAARTEKTFAQTSEPWRTWAGSSQPVQANHIADNCPHACRYRGPAVVNQAPSLFAGSPSDIPVDDGRAIEASGGGHGIFPAAGGRDIEDLSSLAKHESLVAVRISDRQPAEDASQSESSEAQEMESSHSSSARNTKGEYVRPNLARFGADWRSCRTHGPEKRRVSVERQLAFIRNSQALVAGRSFLSLGTSAAGDRGCDWMVRCFMNVAVLSNVVVLGFQAESDWIGWVIVDASYVLVFAFELAYRVVRGGVVILTWKDQDWRWNWFDIVLVIMTATDVAFGLDNLQNRRPLAENAFSHVGPLRILRITRILRIFRLSHVEFFRDLGLMVVGAIGGLRTLMCSLVMIAVPVYAVALFFTETLGQSGDPETMSLFSTVRMSLFTSFRCLVLADCSDSDGTPIFLKVLLHHHWGYISVYCLACVGMSVGLFSVIVAIYVESTMVAARANQTLQRRRRIEDNYRLSSKLFDLVHHIYHELKLGPADKEFHLEEGLSAEMDRETFRRVIQDERVRSLLRDCDVPEDDFSQLFDVCDSDGGGILSLDEFIGGIRKLRGVPSRSDVVWIMLRVQEMQDGIQHLHARVGAIGRGRTKG